MMDLFYLLIICFFFLTAITYVYGCSKLDKEDGHE